MNTTPLILYYDGLCPLCSREMDHYKKCVANDPAIVFLDITDPAFDPAAHGLDPARIHKVMHVKEGDVLHTGIDAFIVVWRRIPGHAWMARLSSVPGMYWLMKLGYHTFAAIRPFLPRRKRACDSGSCQRD